MGFEKTTEALKCHGKVQNGHLMDNVRKIAEALKCHGKFKSRQTVDRRGQDRGTSEPQSFE